MRNYLIASILVIGVSTAFVIVLNTSKPDSKAMKNGESGMQMMGSETMAGSGSNMMGEESMAPQMATGGMSRMAATMEKNSDATGREMVQDENGAKMRDEKNKMSDAMMKEKMDSAFRPAAN